jgi:hypothetical protein
MVNKKEINKAVQILKKIKPGFLPKELFFQMCRLNVMPLVDMVILRQREDKIEVLLTKRSDNDPFFANTYHLPGSIMRPSDQKGSLNDIFQRILKKELNGIKVVQGPKFVDFSFQENKRGSELSMLHWLEVKGNNNAGRFFDINQLPEKFLPFQKPLLKLAVNDFTSTN